MILQVRDINEPAPVVFKSASNEMKNHMWSQDLSPRTMHSSEDNYFGRVSHEAFRIVDATKIPVAKNYFNVR